MTDIYTSWRIAFDSLIDNVGVPATFTPAGGAGQSIKCAMSRPQPDRVIGDYTEDSRVVTISAPDVTVAPKQFDRLTVNGNGYVISSVAPLNVQGTIVAYRCMVQG